MGMEVTDGVPGGDAKLPWQAPVLKSVDVRRATGDFSGVYFDGGSKGQLVPKRER